MVSNERYEYILSLSFIEMVDVLKENMEEAVEFLKKYINVSKYKKKEEILTTLCGALGLDKEDIKLQAKDYVEPPKSNKRPKIVNTPDIKVIETTLEVKNYKSINYLQIRLLTNINIFVGPNNIGKTVLLEYIHSKLGSKDCLFIPSTTRVTLDLVKSMRKFRYVCIDEIENGLHFTTIEQLADELVMLCKEMGAQLFIASHSHEFIHIFNTVTFRRKYKNAAVYNIAKTKLKGLQTYRFDMDGVAHMIKYGTEFRE